MSKQTESPDGNGNLATKRSLVLGSNKNRRPLVGTVSIVVLLLAVFGYFLLGAETATSTSSQPKALSADAKTITLQVSDFEDGTAKFFTYDGSGEPSIRYYVVKGSDGRLHTAYDACDACWQEGKGYKQAGEVMICQNCRRSFPINKIGEVHGGCNPSPLPSRIEGKNLLIEISDLAAGRRYFAIGR